MHQNLLKKEHKNSLNHMNLLNIQQEPLGEG